MSSDSLYREVFNQFDLNGDGNISVNELRVAVRTAGVNISDDTVQEILKSADINSSGGLDYKEFVCFVKLAAGSEDAMPPRPKELFDAAADGFDLVGPNELAALTQAEHSLSAIEAAVLSGIADNLQGRSVDLTEFVGLWRQVETKMNA